MGLRHHKGTIRLAGYVGLLSFLLFEIYGIAIATAVWATVAIMPVGDSITHGTWEQDPPAEGDKIGYRKRLHDLLVEAGYDIDLVGNDNAGYNQFSDSQNEGHEGWETGDIATHIRGWLQDNPADIVLLHIGANDLNRGRSIESAVDNVETILDEIDRYSPDVVVYLARIIPKRSDHSTWHVYNDALEEMANNRPDDKIFMVDQESGFSDGYFHYDTQHDYQDLLHPSQAGYNRMADVWFDALDAHLEQSGGTGSGTRFTLSIALSGEGIGGVIGPGIDCHPDCEEIFDPDDSVTITAVLQDYSVFDHWEGDCTGTDVHCSLTMDGDHAATAVFRVKQFVVTAAAEAHGAIEPAGEQSVDYGDELSFTVNPDDGYHVVSVTGDTCSVEDRGSGVYQTGPITADCQVHASFAINTYAFTTRVEGHGIVSPTFQHIEHGSPALLKVIPDDHYHINEVAGDACTVTHLEGMFYQTSALTGPCEVTASFAIDTFAVRATAGRHGSVSPTGDREIAYGNTASFTVEPEAHYHVAEIKGDTCTLTDQGDGVYTTDTITRDCQIMASFQIDTFAVSGKDVAHGTVTPLSQNVSYGGSASFTVNPEEGYHLERIQGDHCEVEDVGAGHYQTSAIVMPCVVTPVFALNRYQVVGRADPHGSIVNPVQEVTHGSPARFQIQVDPGYDLHSIDTQCGGALAGLVYTTAPVTGDCDFIAHFTDDIDEDGIRTAVDNCPDVANGSQEDLDGDGLGNVCDDDIDGDTIPNNWEESHGLNPYDFYDGAGDSDGDSFSNREEYHFQTDPRLPDDDADHNHRPDNIDARWHRVPILIIPLLLSH